MRKKCPICNSCLITKWILPDVYLYCWLCKRYFKIIDGKVEEVTLSEEQKRRVQ